LQLLPGVAIALVAALFFLPLKTGHALSSAVSSVSQHGITWYFDATYQAGQYANGDWWVVGPVTITRITPESRVIDDGRVVNGSMVNPKGSVNGWDSHSSTELSAYPKYDGRYNVAPSITGRPLTIEQGSIVSAISRTTGTIGGSNRSIIDKYAILTVTPEAPLKGAFRPDPYGEDKRSHWTESMLNYGILQNLPVVGSAPALADVTKSVEGFWNDHLPDSGGLRQQPFTASSFQRSYGRDIGNASARALLSLHLDFDDDQKRDLFVHMVQKGIDVYRRQQLGGEWPNNGGHYGSQKARMVLAAMALGDPAMKAASDAKAYLVHGMDQQTFYVSQEDVDRVSSNNNDPNSTSGNKCGTSGASLYEPSDLGMPEWGRNHTSAPSRFDCRIFSVSYRWIGASYAGNILAMQLIPGAKQVWNNPALFDYSDRYFLRESSSDATWGVGGGANQLHPFFVDMYDPYRYVVTQSGDAGPMAPVISVD
jgi:hypothetical protein